MYLATDMKPTDVASKIRMLNYFTVLSRSLALSFFLFFHFQPGTSYSCAPHLISVNSCIGPGHHNSSQKAERSGSGLFLSVKETVFRSLHFLFHLARANHVTAFSCKGSARRPAGGPTRLDRLMPGLEREQRLRRQGSGIREKPEHIPRRLLFLP